MIAFDGNLCQQRIPEVGVHDFASFLLQALLRTLSALTERNNAMLPATFSRMRMGTLTHGRDNRQPLRPFDQGPCRNCRQGGRGRLTLRTNQIRNRRGCPVVRSSLAIFVKITLTFSEPFMYKDKAATLCHEETEATSHGQELRRSCRRGRRVS